MVELRPALRTKEFHEAVASLVADGRTTPRGAPKNPLQLDWGSPGSLDTYLGGVAAP